MVKMLSYQGLFVILPLFVLNLLELGINRVSEANATDFMVFLIIMFGIVLLFDYLGLLSSKMDINSRKISLILCYIGAVFLVILAYTTRSVWDNTNFIVLFSIGVITACYLLIGWFYIRSEKTHKPSKEDKPLRSSAHCFIFCGIPWALGYFINQIAILYGCAISLVCYLVVVLIGDKRLTEDPKNIVKPSKLAVREDLVAISDFIADISKAIALSLTIIVLSYNGEMILYPTYGLTNSALIFRNLMWVSISAATTCYVFERLETFVYGKFLVVLVLLAALLHVLLTWFGYSDQWLSFAVLNGITLAGVIVFTEQKITKSPNIRVVPGLMFFVIYILQLLTLLLNNVVDIFPYMNAARVIIGVGGGLYVYYRIYVESKVPDLKKKGVRISPLGIKYTSIPENGDENKA